MSETQNANAAESPAATTTPSVTEPTKESANQEQSNKGDAATSNQDNATKAVTTDDKSTKVENELKALREAQSGKDKQIAEMQKKVEETERNQKNLENQLKVRELLGKTDLPKEVKDELENEISDLTPENFEARANKYKSFYEAGRSSLGSEVIRNQRNDPDPVASANLEQKLKEAQQRGASEKEINDILAQG